MMDPPDVGLDGDVFIMAGAAYFAARKTLCLGISPCCGYYFVRLVVLKLDIVLA